MSSQALQPAYQAQGVLDMIYKTTIEVELANSQLEQEINTYSAIIAERRKTKEAEIKAIDMRIKIVSARFTALKKELASKLNAQNVQSNRNAKEVLNTASVQDYMRLLNDVRKSLINL